MRHRRQFQEYIEFSRLSVVAGVILFAQLGAFFLTQSAFAAISYTTSGATITQDFNGLPTDAPGNANIEGTTASPGIYTDGWRDDLNSTATSFGIEGWYLRYPTNTGTGPDLEGGFNGRQRIRVGTGANTGAFWAFGSSATDTEKALGTIGSTTVAGNGANMLIGMQLINNTGSTLTSFTITYDGEQWRDGQSTVGETMFVDYNIGATSADWFSATFTPIPSASFTALNVAGTSSGGTGIDGNTNVTANITGTINNISWAPGQELWIRWADPQLASLADDGLAIDNVRFKAPGDVIDTDFDSVASGIANSGTTWDNGQPPVFGATYHVLNGHTVTVDGPFAGSILRAESGGAVDISAGGNGQTIPSLIITANGNLTESVAGDFSLGSATATPRNTLQLDRDIALTIDPGPASPDCDLCLNMKIDGPGDIDINSALGTSVAIPAAGAHDGTIRFNGTGDVVKINGTESVADLEMNSTGINKVVFVSNDVGRVSFNQSGSIDHVTTVGRLRGAGTFLANAPVTVNLNSGFPNSDPFAQTDERRFQTNSLTGSGNVTINGTPTDLTAHATGADHVTLNEFEIGSTGEPAGNLGNSTFAGVLTANDFVNVELRENLTRAGVVVNQNARVEFGHQIGQPNPAKSLSVGEITVNNGGILEVGFEQVGNPSNPAPPTSAFFVNNGVGTGHNPNHLNVTSIGGRSGNLTMTSGAKLRMQINGTGERDFDTLSVTGNINLGGSTLEILMSPPGTVGDDLNDPNDLNDNYTAQIGDTFTILSIAPNPVPGDYNRNGVVDNDLVTGDHAVWKAAHGETGVQAADGNNDGVVDAADYIVWREHLGQSSATTGSIIGQFASPISIIDPNNVMFGLDFDVIYTATSVQLKVKLQGSGAAAPEPTSLVLGLMLLPLAAVRRRRAA